MTIYDYKLRFYPKFMNSIFYGRISFPKYSDLFYTEEELFNDSAAVSTGSDFPSASMETILL